MPAARRRSSVGIRFIPLSYDNKDCDASALRLIYALVPEWETSEGHVKFIRFTDGITNTLLKAEKRRPGQSQLEIDQESLLMRAYGEGTDVLIDREREIEAHTLLASRRLAPPLFARFNNGLLYRFTSGDVCTPQDIREPAIYRSVAQMLGSWHGALSISAISDAKDLEAPGTNGADGTQAVKKRPEPNLWSVMQSWIDALPRASQKERERIADIQSEYNHLAAKLADSPGLDGKDYVFSHCDLLSGNVIVQKPETPTNGHNGECGTPKISFIDYEYASPAPAAFDIANHFAEWAGFECDHGAMPTRSQRREFLASYVRSFKAETRPGSSDEDLKSATEEIFAQVDMYRGVPGFYWGIWALIQAQISHIEFDYASYAEQRFGEYKAWKAELDGSRKHENRDMPLRERKWAEE